MSTYLKRAQKLLKYWRDIDKEFIFILRKSEDEEIVESQSDNEIRVIVNLYE